MYEIFKLIIVYLSEHLILYYFSLFLLRTLFDFFISNDMILSNLFYIYFPNKMDKKYLMALSVIAITAFMLFSSGLPENKATHNLITM